MSQPPKTFADLAEAKAATKKLLEKLKDNQDELLKLAAEGETQQQKIAKLMPKVQQLLGPEIMALGFPPAPMGLPSTRANPRHLLSLSPPCNSHLSLA